MLTVRAAKTRKVLVLGEDARALLGVIRSLGRAGIEVHLSCPRLDSLARHSRFVSQLHELPCYATSPGSWRAEVINVMQRERFDLVIPCSDATVLAVQTHRRELEASGKLYTLSDHAFEVVSDKFKVNDLARAAGVRLPREQFIFTLNDADEVRQSFQLPIVLKPRSSLQPEFPDERQTVRKVYAWEEFETCVAQMLTKGPIAAQENVIGQGVGVELLLNQGVPLLEFQHVRLHEPLRGGGSSYRQSVRVTPALREAALAILAPLKYTGVAMAEFKVNPLTQDWAFVEINGRFWGSLPLAVASRANFPLGLFQLLVEGRVTISSAYRVGICCRNWTQDYFWQGANLRADHADRTLATRPVSKVLGDLLVTSVTLRERSDTFTLDDPRPGWVEGRRLAAQFRQSLVRKCTARLLQSRLIRKLYQHRAQRALQNARTILFICKGNICRSPFALRVAQQYWPQGALCRSAGYYPVADRRAPASAVAAAAALGVDLLAHRSTALNSDAIQDADVVFVFDRDDHERVLRQYHCPGKLHYLGALLPTGPLWIDDPYGRDQATFLQTYRQIQQAIAANCEIVKCRAQDSAELDEVCECSGNC